MRAWLLNETTCRPRPARLVSLLGLAFGILAASAQGQVFSVADISVAEDTGLASFTVTLTGAPASPATYSYTVDYVVADGTAIAADGDYTAVVGAQTLAFTEADATTATVAVTLGADALDEPDETLTLTLTAVAGGASIDPAATTATATVTNDDVPALTITGVTVGEGDGGPTTQATVTVSMDNASTQPVTVQADTADDVAVALEGDYVPVVAQAVTIPAGLTSATVGVTVNDDTLDEPNETITISLSAPGGGASGVAPTLSVASATITVDNDDTPTISIVDGSASEAEASGVAQALVTLTNASTAAITVTATSAGATATEGVDYTAVAATITIAPGETTATVDVPLIDDGIKEINETLTLTLSAPGGGATSPPTIGDGAAVVTIVNDDDALPATALTVTVSDAVDSGLVEGATVSVFLPDGVSPAVVQDGSPSKSTDASGVAIFAGLLQAVDYVVHVEAGSHGYIRKHTADTTALPITMTTGGETLGVSLDHTSVSVTVEDEDATTSPSGIPGATVVIAGLPPQTTDANGIAVLTQVPTDVLQTVTVTGPAEAGTTRYQGASLAGITVSESVATVVAAPIVLSNVRLQVVVTTEDPAGDQVAFGGASVTITGVDNGVVDLSAQSVQLLTALGDLDFDAVAETSGVADFGDPSVGGGILAGDYIVTVVNAGHVTSVGAAPVTVGTSAVAADAAALAYTSITIHVSSGGIDISGVAVAAALDGGGVVTPPRTLPSPAVTDAGGLVELRGIDGTSGQVHTLTMSKDGFVTSSIAGQQISDTASTGTIDVLTPAISVDVSNAAGAFDGVNVTVSGPSGTFTAITNQTPTTVGGLSGTVGPGHAVFPTLLAGDYTVTASLDGWISAQQTPVTLAATTQSAVALVLTETQLTVTVSGIDISDDVTVTLPAGANIDPLTIPAVGSSENFVFTGATGGVYDAVVTGAGYENLTVSATVDAAPGATVTTATGALVKNTASITVTPDGATAPAPFVAAGRGVYTATKVLASQSVDITKVGYITQTVDLTIDADGVLDAQQSATPVTAVDLQFTSLTVDVTEGPTAEEAVPSENARVVLLVFDDGAGTYIAASGSVAGDTADKLTVAGQAAFAGFDANGDYQLNISQEGFTPRLGLSIADDGVTNVDVSADAPVVVNAVLIASLTLDVSALPTIYRGESYSVGSISIPGPGTPPFAASVTSEDAPNVFEAYVQGSSIQISAQAADTMDIDAALSAVNMTLSFADSGSPPTGGTTTLTAQVDDGIGVFDAYGDSIIRGGNIVVALRNVGASRTVDFTVTPAIAGLTMPTALEAGALGQAAAGDVEAIVTIPADATPGVYTIGATVSGIDLDRDGGDDVPAGTPATVDIVVVDTLSAVSISSVDPTLISGISGAAATVTITMLSADEAASVADIQLVDPSGAVALAAPVSAGGSPNLLTFVVPQGFAPGIYTLYLDAQGPTGVAGGAPTGQYVAIADAIQDGWQSSLTITTTDGFSRTVFFGAAVNATTGFNAQEDVPLPPDEPQRLVTTMVLRRAGAPTTGLLRDIVATSSIDPPNPDPVLTWQLDVLVPDAQTGALSWSSDFLNGTLTGYFDNAFIDLPNGDTLDMRDRGTGTGGISLPPGSHTLALRLERSDADHLLSLSLGEGWTAMSLPGPPDGAIATIGSLRNALGANTIWKWDAATQSYARPLSTDLVQHVDTAYFVHRASAADVDINVNIDTRVARQVTVPIDAGWNFVGAIQADPSSNQLNDAFSTGPNSVFEYDPATQNYAVATALAPGRGYWVLATGADSVVFA
ncbi:hypothetical protein HOK31_20770, partial [Candidatus Poribacteria bacterium]|nr:hypothetical protein [Candidatus Poribacteria bacterium]